MYKVFLRNVDRVRVYKEMSLSELSQASGLSRQTISKVVRFSSENDYSLKIGNAIALAKALNVNFTCLFSRIEDSDMDSLDPYVDENYLVIFRDNVKKTLHKRKKIQNWLSYAGNIQQSTVSQILNGKVSDPYLSSLTYIAEQLDVDIKQFFKRNIAEKKGEKKDDI